MKLIAPEQIGQQVVGQILWGGYIVILEVVKEPSARLWYIPKVIENGWSRNILNVQIKS